MKKRVLSALLVLCMACSMVSTVWAANEQATPETAGYSANEQAETDIGDTSKAEPTINSTDTDLNTTSMKTEAEIDGQTVNVLVDVPEGAFAEGVTPVLHAEAVTGEDADQAAETVADQTGAAFDGMMVLDVYFTDGDNTEEIEPALPVSVRFELPEAIVDSGIDLSTLAVQHLVEDEAGKVIAVEQVASVAEGGVTLSAEAQAALAAQANEETGIAPMSDAAADSTTETAEAAVVAEFEVESFSYFTITWEGGRNQGDGTARVEFWDTANNRQLDVSGLEDVDLTQGATYTSEQLKAVIDGVTVAGDYAYSSVTVGYYDRHAGRWNAVYNSFDSISATYHDGDWPWESSYWQYTVNGWSWNQRSSPVIRVNYSQPLPMFRGEDTEGMIDIDLYNYTTNDDNRTGINFENGVWRPFQFSESPGTWGSNPPAHGGYIDDNVYYSNRVNQGIVQNDLGSDGYPVLTDNANTSLSYLFGEKEDTDTVDGKTKYNDVNYLFQIDEDGYYYYDSSQYFATVMLNDEGEPYGDGEENTNDIWLYGNPGSGISNDGQAFMPFNTLTGSRYNPSIAGDEDYLFGMKVGFTFIMPENGMVNVPNSNNSQQMTFEFAGDDDVWVFIDGKLVLDIGGIHNNYEGSINFATGEVYVQNGNTNGTNQTKYIWDLLGYESEAEWKEVWTFEEHTLNFFYFERGGGESNCKIKFNMPMIPTDSIAISKRVTGDAPEGTSTSYTMKFVAQNSDFNYDEVTWNVANGEPRPLGVDNTFTVQAGQTVYLNGIPADTKYQIHELNVGDVTSVTINGVDKTPMGDDTTAISDVFDISEDKAVTVTNAYPVQPPEGFGITTDKTAVRQDDDPTKYELSLSMTGDRDRNDPEPTPVDILFIVDRSGSMSNPIGNGNGTSRISAVRTAISTLVNDLEAQKSAGRLDPRYSVVAFAGAIDRGDGYYGDAGTSVLVDWTSNGNTVTTNIDRMTVLGGTNWDAAIQTGTEQLDEIRRQNAQDPQNVRDADQIVIFLSDGVPTYGGINDSIGNGSNTGYDSDVEGSADAAVKSVANMQCDRFYAVGIGPDFVQDEDGYKYMNNLRNAVPNATTDIFSAQDPNTLKEKFEDIAESLTFFSCVDVVMIDQLSPNADLAQAQGSVTFTVQLERWDETTRQYVVIGSPQNNVADGSSATFDVDQSPYGQYIEETVVITPSVEYAEGQQPTIKVTLTGENGAEYETEPGVRYTVKTMITPSDAAKDAYAEKGDEAYTDTPDGFTGTHAPNETDKENGFYSNVANNAKVTYNVKSTTDGVDTKIPGSEPFPRPVIQVQSASLTIQKAVEGLPDGSADEVDATKFTFTITGPAAAYNDQPTGGYSIANSSDKVTFNPVQDGEAITGATATVTITGDNAIMIDGLPAGTYKVTENTDGMTGIVDGYRFAGVTYTVNDVESNSVTLEAAGTGTVVATNHYEHDDVKLTINKTVTGPMGDTSPENKFAFTLTTSEEISKIANPNFPDGVNVDGMYQYIFELAHNGTIEIVVPYGAEVTVWEEDRTDYTEQVRQYVTPPEEGEEEIGAFFTNGNTATIETMNDDYTVDFQNFRDVVAPTGLESNHTTPYVLMITAAGMAGLALIGGIVARRIRRRRQE